MTAIAEGYVSNAACARYYNVGNNTVATDGLILKPQNSETWGQSANWSYNSSTGLFTLSSNHVYQLEADLYFGRTGSHTVGHVISGFTDGSGTELSDSCRGRTIFFSAETYYEEYTIVSDETAYAIIDGSSVSSFYWKVFDFDYVVESGWPPATAVAYLDVTTMTGYNTYGAGGCRLIIREYPA